jgi:hypothetical protein
MSRSLFQRFVLAALLVLLTAPWSSAATERRASVASPKHPQAVSLPHMSTLLTYFHGLWIKAGCGIDPSGSPLCNPTPSSSSDAGCGIDPDGCFGVK